MNEKVFQTKQAQEIIRYIRNKYGDELEFLWPKSPKSAIWRNKTNRKWYALIMTVPRTKLGFNSGQPTEVLDLRFDKGMALDFAASNDHILPGYHMNKDNWITILLDDGMSIEQIKNLINHSYEISLGKS